jgi:hypothetical protein
MKRALLWAEVNLYMLCFSFAVDSYLELQLLCYTTQHPCHNFICIQNPEIFAITAFNAHDWRR